MFLKVPLRVVLVIVYGAHIVVSASEKNINSQRYRRQASCNRNEFRCKNGDCISSYDKCDGTEDCPDGSDETFAACKGSGLDCPLMSFQCEYGACLNEGLRCDGKRDCADGSDEKGCPLPAEFPNIIQSTNSCNDFEFQCSNGQCINSYDICDNIKNCHDGSDESRNQCLNFECPPRSFKCYSGACLDLSLKCNGNADCLDGSDEGSCPTPHPPTTAVYRPPSTTPTTTRRPTTPTTTRRPTPRTTTSRPLPLQSSFIAPSGNSCKLPDHPIDGTYISAKCRFNDPQPACRNTPGTDVPNSWALKYICNNGYILNKDSDYSICENGVWKNHIDCIKLCPPLTSLSVNVRCVFGGEEVDCSKPMKPDTEATAACKTHYKRVYLPEYAVLRCLRKGEWSYPLFYCVPDCGLSSEIEDQSGNVEPLISNGTPAKLGKFPWLAAIYRKTVNLEWDQQCGGTLVTPHIVVTAAHCLVNSENIKLHPTDIRVGLGKYFRSYYANERSAVISEVKEVVISPHYVGLPSQYARDVGLLDLVVSVQVSAIIMPACVDWTNPFVPARNATGVVAGWGRTEEGGESSEFALSARLRFIKYEDCLKSLRIRNRWFLTHDKFCAGSIEGGQVNKGDNGGGLTFLNDGKHFLVGVVSQNIPGNSSVSLFSDITNQEHSDWLKEEQNRLNQSHSET